MAWSSQNLAQDGQTDWLVHLYEKSIQAVRNLGGLPQNGQAISVKLPELIEQARVQRARAQMPPGHNTPTGVLEWEE